MTILPEFDIDVYPEKTRVLFVGFSESSHTHSWIGLLDGAEINVRLFALPTGTPPDDWQVRTYLTNSFSGVLDSEIRATLENSQSIHQWLAQIIREWQPHVIHTLGLEPAGHLYFEARQAFHLGKIGRWVLQLRGGSDLALNRFNPEVAPKIGQVLQEADQILSDNRQNFEIAETMGVRKEQFSSFGIVPGTGGINVEELLQHWEGRPSSRRVILYPKAYNTPWSTAFPVLEALKLCWGEIQPCEVYLLAITPEVKLWYRALPEEIRDSCHVHERLPRQQLLDLLTRSRVLLAPSLVDGTPNTLFEAMAAGAFPIVSPLETISAIVKAEDNVLFARNLYPNEIADALVRAMNDDQLVDKAAQSNIRLVSQIADRAKFAPRVIAYYRQLASEISPEGAEISDSEVIRDFSLSPWSSLMPEGQSQAGLIEEYRSTNYQLITLQTHYRALQQEYMIVVNQLIALQTNHTALQQEYGSSQSAPYTTNSFYRFAARILKIARITCARRTARS